MSQYGCNERCVISAMHVLLILHCALLIVELPHKVEVSDDVRMAFACSFDWRRAFAE